MAVVRTTLTTSIFDCCCLTTCTFFSMCNSCSYSRTLTRAVLEAFLGSPGPRTFASGVASADHEPGATYVRKRQCRAIDAGQRLPPLASTMPAYRGLSSAYTPQFRASLFSLTCNHRA
eukprot:1797041-Amphidinium_carterae.1